MADFLPTRATLRLAQSTNNLSSNALFWTPDEADEVEEEEEEEEEEKRVRREAWMVDMV